VNEIAVVVANNGVAIVLLIAAALAGRSIAHWLAPMIERLIVVQIDASKAVSDAIERMSSELMAIRIALAILADRASGSSTREVGGSQDTTSPSSKNLKP